MKTFDILIDSCGEMPRDMREAYGVDFIPMYLSTDIKGDIHEFPALIDYDGEYDFHSFYDLMRKGIRIRTAAVSEAAFEEYFREAVKRGHDVLYLACSSGLSVSVELAKKVAAKLNTENPEWHGYCLDTLISGFPIADMAIKADAMRKEGKDVNEVGEYLDSIKLKYNQFATVETLTYLKNAGRVTASKAFFGNLFHVKPIIISDVKGHNVATVSEKGRRASLQKIVDLTVEAAENIEEQTIYISHGDDEAAANFVKEALLKVAKPKDIRVDKCGPIIGASSGPGLVICYCFGKEVTFAGE